MQLTTYTDYSIRVLLYLGALNEQERSNIKEIASIYQISEHHLGKIVFELGKLGLIKTIRGRNGGICLAKSPNDINLGWLVRQTEGNVTLVECFNGKENACVISPVCTLKGVLYQALQAFFSVLDSYTLADLITNKVELSGLLRPSTLE